MSPLVAVATVFGALFALAGPAAATTVTADIGSAYGVSANVALFGSPQPPFGPAPTVTLPAGGHSVISANAASEDVVYGPATFFSSGTEKVTTKGTIGATGSVVSTTSVASASQAAGTCPGTETACVYAGPFTADSMASHCKATQTALTGKATFVNGQLVTATDTNGNPTTTVVIAASPKKNYTVSGYLYAGTTDKETFTWTFNQQTVNPNGSITIYAAHQHLNGPTAVGDLYIGQSVCGVTKA
jgi:hypothetical protein